jgi:hypothetical protein
MIGLLAVPLNHVPPVLSVVLPLVDDRGFGEAALASWVGQTLDPRSFEIVAVTDDSRSRLARRARSFLRPHDRLLLVPGAREMELYQAGGEAARADLLLFTEAHCVAEREVAEALVRRLAASRAAAAMSAGEPLASNAIARFETRLHRESLRDYPADRWRRVALRGLAIRRTAWIEAGMFATECGRLAEAILAVRLDRRGHSIEHCPDARIRHGNCARLRDLAVALRPHGRGQAAWRERCEAGLEAEFLPRLSDWSERARWEPRVARHAARVLLRVAARRAVRREWRESAAVARTLPAFLAASLFGARVPRLLAAARAAWFLAACRWRWGEERRYRSYARASSELLRWGVLDHAAASALPAAPSTEILFPADLPDGAFVGFHAAERWSAGEIKPSCRWTRPFAILRLGLAAADYRLTLDLRSPVAPERRALRLFFNGSPTTASPDGSFALRRDGFRPGEQLLTILCAPFRPARSGLPDPRELGVALFSLRFERLPGTEPPARRDSLERES